MRIFVNSTVFVLIVLGLLVSSSNQSYARLQLSREFTRSLPDSVIQGNIYFVDVNGDMAKDLITTSSAHVAQYDLENDELVSFIHKSWAPYPHRIWAEGFIDDNNAMDAIHLFWKQTDTAQILCYVLHLDSSRGNPTDTQIVLTRPASYWDEWEAYQFASAFVSKGDSGASPSIYVNTYYLTTIIGGGTVVYTTREFFKIDPFTAASEKVWSIPQPDSYTRYPFFPSEDPVHVHYYQFSNTRTQPGQLGVIYKNYFLLTFVRGGTEMYRLAWSINHCDSYNWVVASNAFNRGYLIADFLSGYAGFELIASVAYGTFASAPFGPDSVCALSHSQVYKYSLQHDAPVLVDSMPPPENYDLRIMFADPNYPDQIFNLDDDRLYLMSANNLSRVDSSDELPDLGVYQDYTQLSPGGSYYAIFRDDNDLNFYRLDSPTPVESPDDLPLPSNFVLGKPYPNPFNPSVQLSLSIPARGDLRVEVFNILGRRVGTAFEGPVTAGEQTISWDGSAYASGVYYFKATFGDSEQTVKAVLLK